MNQDSETSTGKAEMKQSEEPAGHVMSVPALVGVFAALLVLTGATVAATWGDLGAANMLIAMGIATVKAILVALFFMHLLYDRPFNALVFCTAWLFVAIFVVFTLLDTVQYHPELGP